MVQKNQIEFDCFLVISGYMPEWILLEKQVRQSIDQARINLKRVFKTIATESSEPSDEQKIYLKNNTKWAEALRKFRADIAETNVDINKLNLIVPMLWRQQVYVLFKIEIYIFIYL
jgi:DnaJ family protein C protein 28